MDMDTEFHAALAALGWQVDLGADEAIGELPVNRYVVVPAVAVDEVRVAPRAAAAVPVGRAGDGDALRVAQPAAAAVGGAGDGGDAVRVAQAAAAAAHDLAALRDALAGYDHCELKKGAKTLVFADGNPRARVLVLGEAPGRDEEMEGRPFVGRAGRLLDQMFAAIGLARGDPDPARALYLTNVLPWRPPQNREPTPQEMAMLLPFVERHIALVDPAVIVVMGKAPLQALLGTSAISRLRGQWAQALGKPVLPMVHPDFLLRTPQAKREAWADLLTLQARLRAMP